MKEYLDVTEIVELKKLDSLTRANMLVDIVFKDIYDRSGAVYLRHLNKVAESFKKSEEKVVALLHDLVEDTSFTFDDLKVLGFSEKVIETLKLLTNDLDDYDKYIKRLIASDNILAKRVKVADLLDNMNINRFENLNKEVFLRLKAKYIKAFIDVTEDLERRIEK